MATATLDKVSVAELAAEDGSLLPARDEMVFDIFQMFNNFSAVAIGTNQGQVIILNFYFFF